MNQGVIDRLLVSLDVELKAFAVCTVKSGFRLTARPGTAIEVHYVLEGTMHLTVPDCPAIMCGPGSVVLVPPGLAQSIGANDGPARDVTAADNCAITGNGLLLFDGTGGGSPDLRFACGTIDADISGSFGLLDAVRKPIVEDLGSVDVIRTNLAMIAEETRRPGVGSTALTGALMKTCLIILIRRHFARGAFDTVLLSTLRDARLGRAVSAVLDNPSARHSVAALASVAGMSRSAFAREFSTALNMSPMEFVARTRLHHAAEMLQATRMPVKAIAASIGFSSRSHFSRAFRDNYGADPSTFRRKSDKVRFGAEASIGRERPPTRRRSKPAT